MTTISIDQLFRLSFDQIIQLQNQITGITNLHVERNIYNGFINGWFVGGDWSIFQ